jgi:hypothetical protein
MPEPLTVRQLDIHLAEPHPRIVIDRPLAERLPLALPIARLTSHGHDVNASRHARTPRDRAGIDRVPTRVPGTCESFLYVFKGTPAARQAEQPAMHLGAGRRASAKASGRRAEPRGMGDMGASAVRWGGSPLPAGGNPPSRQPPGPADPAPDARRYSPPRRRWPGPPKSWRPSSPRQPSCRRAKITVKGAHGVANAMAQAPPLSSDLPRQQRGAYQEDGGETVSAS